MARKPENFEWVGFSPEQGKLLDQIDFYGNNGWARNTQSEVVLPSLLGEWEATGGSVEEVQRAMAEIRYSPRAIHQLLRWERRRTTGKFGR